MKRDTLMNLFITAFLMVITIFLFLKIYQESTLVTNPTEEVGYQITDQTMENGIITVQLQNNGDVSSFDQWLSQFTYYAMGVLEDFITIDSIKEIRVYETSSFLAEDVEVNASLEEVTLTEETVFDLKITKEKAMQLNYTDMETIATNEPYQLFNQADSYTIHTNMFQTELSTAMKKGFK